MDEELSDQAIFAVGRFAEKIRAHSCSGGDPMTWGERVTALCDEAIADAASCGANPTAVADPDPDPLPEANPSGIVSGGSGSSSGFY